MTVDSYVLVKGALNEIYKHSFDNKAEIERSQACYCIYCKEEFSSGEIKNWVVNGRQGKPLRRNAIPEETALCPKCGIDSVIGDASGYEMTPALIHAMHEFWFERKVLPDDFDYSWFEPVDG